MHWRCQRRDQHSCGRETSAIKNQARLQAARMYIQLYIHIIYKIYKIYNIYWVIHQDTVCVNVVQVTLNWTKKRALIVTGTAYHSCGSTWLWTSWDIKIAAAILILYRGQKEDVNKVESLFHPFPRLLSLCMWKHERMIITKFARYGIMAATKELLLQLAWMQLGTQDKKRAESGRDGPRSLNRIW